MRSSEIVAETSNKQTLDLKKYLKDTRCLRTQWATTTKHEFNILKTTTMTDRQ